MNQRMIGGALVTLALAAMALGTGVPAAELTAPRETAVRQAAVQAQSPEQARSPEQTQSPDRTQTPEQARPVSSPAASSPEQVPSPRPSAAADKAAVFPAETGEEVLLVNLWNPLPEDYEVELETLAGGLQIAAEARPALERMLADCAAAGLDVTVCSAYRTEATQTRLYENKIDRLLRDGYSREEAEAEAGRWVAPPGTSEHQTGLAVDIMATDYPVLDEQQADTEEQQWLMEHCWDYGFILRYPTDASDVTGIGYEPWHYRYVGEEIAADIHARGIPLEAYVAVPAAENASPRLQAALDAALAPAGGWTADTAKSDTDSKTEA